MVLKYVLKDVIKQEVVIKFSEVTTFSKMKYEDSGLDETCFQLEIIYQNSRKTRLVVSESVYDDFQKAHTRFIEWLEKNPELEQSRFDIAILNEVLQNAIKSSVEGVQGIGDEIRKNLIETNKDLMESLLQNEELFMNKSNSRMNEIEKQMVTLNESIELIKNASMLINNFIPSDLDKNENEIKELISDVEKA